VRGQHSKPRAGCRPVRSLSLLGGGGWGGTKGWQISWHHPMDTNMPDDDTGGESLVLLFEIVERTIGRQRVKGSREVR
jgi:hypothetical protein